jgi:lambda repressor-like predicted transcriptional regulator
VSNQLRATRRARGLAIWGLSVMSGVSPSLLTAIEKWGYVPGADTRQRIADALGVQVEDIWTQTVSQPQSAAEASEYPKARPTSQGEIRE